MSWACNFVVAWKIIHGENGDVSFFGCTGTPGAHYYKLQTINRREKTYSSGLFHVFTLVQSCEHFKVKCTKLFRTLANNLVGFLNLHIFIVD